MAELKGWTLERAYHGTDPNGDFDIVMRLSQRDGTQQEVTLTREQTAELMVDLVQAAEAEALFAHHMRLSKAMSGRAP